MARRNGIERAVREREKITCYVEFSLAFVKYGLHKDWKVLTEAFAAGSNASLDFFAVPPLLF